MSEFGDRLVGAAREQIGAPFRHHFRPEDICQGGTMTLDSCMEQGLNATGYDCSGLVVASMCRALGLQLCAWPRHLRHSVQLQKHSVIKEFEPGDIQFYYYENGGVHLSVSTTSLDIGIHASGKTKSVEESFAPDGAKPSAQRSMTAEALRDIVLAELALQPEY